MPPLFAIFFWVWVGWEKYTVELSILLHSDCILRVFALVQRVCVIRPSMDTKV